MGGLKDDFLKALASEARAASGFLTDPVIRTVYFGGGTPSLLEPAEIKGILSDIYSIYDCSQVEEITLEANPDDLTPEYLAALSETDVNRLSIGVQSYDDLDLRFMGRRHDARQAEKAVGDAFKEGFTNISADLIYGVPGQSSETWRANLDKAVSLGVQHISAYHLTVEEGTPLWGRMQEGFFTEIHDAESESFYGMLHDTLTQKGYEHYEISNFALPGYRSRHNSSYWDGSQYVGLGPSAHSYNGIERRYTGPSLEKYLQAGNWQDIYIHDKLGEKESLNETLMTSLRRAEGIDLVRFRERFGNEKFREVSSELQILAGEGLIVLEKDTARIPAEKFLLSDMIISRLFQV